MGRISLIAIDLDGTLLTSERVPAPRGARLIRQAARAAVHVVLSTTRNPDGVRAFCRQLEIEGPMICTNGAQVWGSPDGPVWACHTMPRSTALEIARVADARGWELHTTVGDMTYWRQRVGQPLGLLRPGITVVADNVAGVVGDPVRILVWQPEAAAGLRALCDRFPAHCYAEWYVRPDGGFDSLGIFPAHADKGRALALVLERLGIDRRAAMAIGDNPNDVPMFRCAGVSVAMGNAPDEVKRHASAVAPGHDEEGVAWALERFVLPPSRSGDGGDGPGTGGNHADA